MQADTQDPYDTPYPTNQPAAPAPSSDPWTADELAQSQNWANQYFTSHQIPSSYGTPDDIANSYVQFRRGGMSHTDAMAKLQTVPAQLGWEKAPAPDPGTGDPPPPVVTPPPPPTTSGSGPAPSAGTQSAPSVGPGTSAPNYTPPPAYVKPPDFAFRGYTATTGDDVLNDPEYQLMNSEGLRSIGANRAASGLLNTGATLKDYIGFSSNLAGAKFNDIDSRRWNQYQGERGNAFDTWKANNGLGMDVYDRNVTNEYNNPFQYGMQSAGLAQNNDQFNASLGQSNNQFNSNLDFNKWLESYKRSTLDPFDMKYKTLSLL